MIGHVLPLYNGRARNLLPPSNEKRDRVKKAMINRIDGPRPLDTTSPIRHKDKAKKTASSSFASHLDAPEETAAAQEAGILGSVSGVWDIQEVDDTLARAARGKLRAEDLLEKMDEIRLDLLSGTLTQSTLQRLSHTIASRRAEVDDPKLNEILDEIDLRAQVELAKFTRA
jgi:hypothetical protein